MQVGLGGTCQRDDCEKSRIVSAHLVYVDLVAFDSLLGPPLPASGGFLSNCLLGRLSRFFSPDFGAIFTADRERREGNELCTSSAREV